MAEQKKLDRWAEKLLDTGKRNNLINYKDTKASSVEVVTPDCQSVFNKCSMGHTFEVYDPNKDDKIFKKYNIRSYKKGKAQNKIELQKELGLPVVRKRSNRRLYLIGSISVISRQYETMLPAALPRPGPTMILWLLA